MQTTFISEFWTWVRLRAGLSEFSQASSSSWDAWPEFVWVQRFEKTAGAKNDPGKSNLESQPSPRYRGRFRV